MLVNPMIISTKCIDLLLCTFKTRRLLPVMMVTDYINQLRKKDARVASDTVFHLGPKYGPIPNAKKYLLFPNDEKKFQFGNFEK